MAEVTVLTNVDMKQPFRLYTLSAKDLAASVKEAIDYHVSKRGVPLYAFVHESHANELSSPVNEVEIYWHGVANRQTLYVAVGDQNGDA